MTLISPFSVVIAAVIPTLYIGQSHTNIEQSRKQRIIIQYLMNLNQQDSFEFDYIFV